MNGDEDTPKQLLDLPDAALFAVVDGLERWERGALRAACRRMCAAVDERVRKITFKTSRISAESLACLPQRFPLLTTVNCHYDTSLGLAPLLAALPDGCWQSITCISPVIPQTFEDAPSFAAQAAVHLARLCPYLQQVSLVSEDPDDSGEGVLGAAVESLAPVAPTLQALSFFYAHDLKLGCKLGDAARVGAGLARLVNLRRFEVWWSAYGEVADDAMCLLPAALPALTALTHLKIECSGKESYPLIDGCPTSLLDLSLVGEDEHSTAKAVAMLGSAPMLGGVTRLLLGAGYTDANDSSRDALPFASSKCPSLRELTLSGCDVAQMRMRTRDCSGAAGTETLAHLSQRFPLLATLRFDYLWGDHLASLLAALPDGCWQSVIYVSPIFPGLDDAPQFAAQAAVHLARLCPRLEQASLSTEYNDASSGAALGRALESLAAVAPTLQVLSVRCDCRCFSVLNTFLTIPCSHSYWSTALDWSGGALTLASSKCPNLRERRLHGCDPTGPCAPFAHLTRLQLWTCAVSEDERVDFAVVAPRLEVLECGGDWFEHCAQAFSGHPMLRKLQLNFDTIKETSHVEEWLRGLGTLPRLSRLQLRLGAKAFQELEGESFTGPGHDAACRAHVAKALRRCSRLRRLDFEAPFELAEGHMLRTIGAALGTQLRRLSINKTMPIA